MLYKDHLVDIIKQNSPPTQFSQKSEKTHKLKKIQLFALKDSFSFFLVFLLFHLFSRYTLHYIRRWDFDPRFLCSRKNTISRFICTWYVPARGVRKLKEVRGESKREMALVIVTYEPERYLSAMVIATVAPGEIAAAIGVTVESVASSRTRR